MTEIRHVAVIDIGKTNAKLALVNLNSLSEIAVLKISNTVLRGAPYPRYNIEALWQFIVSGLSNFQRDHGIDAISVTTHGAAAVLLDAKGKLALPVLDYEFDGYGETSPIYQALRPPFSETGSPLLPAGLNLAAQIFWQQKTFPQEFSQVSKIVMYPQYWAFRLTGIISNERSSLGCHTDLWSPKSNDYSALVDRCGWRDLMAPLHHAAEQLGPITPQVAEATGMKASTPVACGIHDSNASLVPHLLSRKKPFSVVSTGTWVISMAIGGGAPVLDEKRDTLINTNAYGEPVPSARFMGGREYQIIMGTEQPATTEQTIADVFNKGIFLLPSVIEGSGPFANHKSKWIGTPSSAERQVAASFYLAMMTATCLDLIHAESDIIIEGPLAGNKNYLDMLSAATSRTVFTTQGATTGTTIGAALLLAPKELAHAATLKHSFVASQIYADYAKLWRDYLVGFNP